jgi:hypothetical protein
MIWKNILTPSSGSKNETSKKQTRSRHQKMHPIGPVGFLFGLLFDPVDGGTVFFQYGIMPQKTAFFKPPLLDPQIQQIHFYRKI